MQRTRERIFKLLIQQMDMLDREIDEHLDIYVRERPYLLGLDMPNRELKQERRDSQNRLSAVFLGVQSTWNQLR